MKKSIIIGIVAFLVASVVFSYPVFWACCFAIDLFAKVTGYTYDEANVVLFLYAQPVILAATAIIGFTYLLYQTASKFKWWKLGVLALYSIPLWVNKAIMTFAHDRYWGIDMDEAFRRSMVDLKYQGGTNMDEYVFLNFAIFVFGFLIVLGVNLLPLFLKPLRK